MAQQIVNGPVFFSDREQHSYVAWFGGLGMGFMAGLALGIVLGVHLMEIL